MALVPIQGPVAATNPVNNGLELVRETATLDSARSAVIQSDGVTLAIHAEDHVRETVTTVTTPSGEVLIEKYIEVHRLMLFAVFVRMSDCADRVVEDQNEEGEDADALVYYSCLERCADFLCQSCTCQLSSLCTCRISDTISSDQVLSDPWAHKARNMGVKFTLTDGVFFPLLNHIVRDIVVGGQLLYTTVGLILSIINYINADCHRTFNVVNFVFGTLAAFLSIVSGIQALYRKNVFRIHCSKTDEESNNAEGNDSPNNDQDSNNSRITQTIDMSRTILAELLIYPLLMCSIFSLVTSRQIEAESANDIVGLARFALSALSYIFFVYIFRLVILGGAIFKIRTMRITDNFVLYFLCYFFVYVMLQMTVQTFMVLATGRKIYTENLHFHNDSYTAVSYSITINSTESDDCIPVRISGYLWYMLMGAYLLPIFGLVMFFVVGYYWVQEFFITMFVEIFFTLKCLAKTPGHDNIFQVRHDTNKMGRSLTATLEKLPQNDILKASKEFRNVGFFIKFVHPFRSPTLTILCILFLLLNFLFISFGAGVFSIGPISFFSALTQSTGWSVVYLVGAVVGILANLYTFLVGIVWLILIEIILAFLVILVPFAICAGIARKKCRENCGVDLC